MMATFYSFICYNFFSFFPSLSHSFCLWLNKWMIAITITWNFSHLNILYNVFYSKTAIKVNCFLQSMTGRRNKESTWVICNRFISLTNIKGDLIVMMLHKWPSTSSGHYTSMVILNKIWYLCNDTNVTVVDINKFRVEVTYSFTKDKYSKEQHLESLSWYPKNWFLTYHVLPIIVMIVNFVFFLSLAFLFYSLVIFWMLWTCR